MTGRSLNPSPSILICRDGKASWPPLIELSCTPFTLCKSYSRQPATKGKGPGAYEGQKVAITQVSLRGGPIHLPLYRPGHWHQRGGWVAQYHWQLLRSQNEQKATSSQDCKGWQRSSPTSVPLWLSAEEALGTATGMGKTAKFSYSELLTNSSQPSNLSAMLRVW